MLLSYINRDWTLPKISRVVVVFSLIVQLVMILFEVEPWQRMDSSLLSGLFILGIVVLPNLLLVALSYTVQGRSIKSWIVFVLSLFLVITTLPVYIQTFYFVAEVPKNAQAGVAILLLPIYQLTAGGVLGGTAWAIASYRSSGENNPKKMDKPKH